MHAVATVYQVLNRVNGNAYVGVTRFPISHRWVQHVYTASRCPKTRLHKAIAKYGKENFDVSAVASCISDANTVERAVIQSLSPVYNQTNGGEITVGRLFAPDVVARIRLANTGRKRTAAQNTVMSTIKKKQYADRPELHAVITERLDKARSLVDEVKRRANVGTSARNRVWSAESRAKLSAACMGRVYGPEVIARSALAKNKPVECLTLNTVFDSILEAAAGTGVHFSNISAACRGKRKSAGGMQFAFV